MTVLRVGGSVNAKPGKNSIRSEFAWFCSYSTRKRYGLVQMTMGFVRFNPPEPTLSAIGQKFSHSQAITAEQQSISLRAM